MPGPDYESMTVEELRAAAKELQLPGRTGMNKEQLIAGLSALAAGEPVAEQQAADEEPDQAEESFGGNGNEPELSEAQLIAVRAASTAELEQALTREGMPQVWIDAFRGELDRRRGGHQPPGPMVTPINRYRVVKGGRIVVSGHVTRLREGGIVSDKTHDLDYLRRSGILLEPLGDQSVVTQFDELGRPVTQLAKPGTMAPAQRVQQLPRQEPDPGLQGRPVDPVE